MLRLLSLTALLLALTCATAVAQDSSTATPDVKAATVIAFGPGDVLFLADPQSAAIFAFTLPAATGDASAIGVEDLGGKIAGLLGTTADRVRINDLAVRPKSREVYVTVTRLSQDAGLSEDQGEPALIVVGPEGKLALVELEKLPFTVTRLADAPDDEVDDDTGRRRRPSQRRESITDLAYAKEELLVAGLSNEEFASTLRSIPFPFRKETTRGTSVEIYHGAHGKLETHSPIRTFTVMDVGGAPHLLAAYTCTPLVKIPISALEAGAHVKGTTIAELGNRNRPLDMVVYQKDEHEYVLIANSSRGVMKVETKDLKADGITEERVERNGTAGVGYETVADWDGIHHLDLFDAKHAAVLRQTEDGRFDLEIRPLP